MIIKSDQIENVAIVSLSAAHLVACRQLLSVLGNHMHAYLLK